MDRVVFVEVLDRAGNVQQRTTIGEGPLTVGRAYTNDLIVDDPFVSPEHLWLGRGEDGCPVVRDRASLNGVHLISPARQVHDESIALPCELRIGQTRLRLRGNSFPVAPALPYAESASWLDHSAVGFAIACALALILLGEQYLGDYQQKSWMKLATGLLPTFVVLVLWAAAWSVLSRIMVQHFRLRQHFIVIAAWWIVLTIFFSGIDFYTFAFSADQSRTALRWGGMALLSTGLLLAHARQCTLQPATQLLPKLMLLVVGGLGLTAAAQHFSNEWTSGIDYPRQIAPPSIRLVRGVSIDEFFSEARDLQGAVDELTRQKEPESPGLFDSTGEF